MGPGFMYLKLMQVWMSGGVGVWTLQEKNPGAVAGASCLPREGPELALGQLPGTSAQEACLSFLRVTNLKESTQDIFP